MSPFPGKASVTRASPGKGCSISLKIGEPLNILAVRECLERATDEEIGCLDALLADYARAITSGTRREASEWDSEFHMIITEMSKNSKLIRFITEIGDFMCLVRTKERPELTIEEREMTICQHRAILEALHERESTARSKRFEVMRANILGMKCKLGLEETDQS